MEDGGSGHAFRAMITDDETQVLIKAAVRGETPTSEVAKMMYTGVCAATLLSLRVWQMGTMWTPSPREARCPHKQRIDKT